MVWSRTETEVILFNLKTADVVPRPLVWTRFALVLIFLNNNIRVIGCMNLSSLIVEARSIAVIPSILHKVRNHLTWVWMVLLLVVPIEL